MVCAGLLFTGQQEREKNIKFMNGNAKFIWNRGEKRRKSQAAVPISIWKRKSCFLLLERSGGKEILPDQERKITDIFRQLLKESLEENQKKDLEKYEQLEKKIKYQQQLLLDKYLEGLVEESSLQDQREGTAK